MPDSNNPHVLGVEVTNSVDLDYITFIDEGTSMEYDTRDWGYFLAPVMEIPDAQARRYEQTIPGMDGKLDLTDALGGTVYENRELTFTFVFANGTPQQYHTEASRIRNMLDGKKFRAILSDDLGWYWVGRCQVEAKRVGRGLMALVITMDAGPYKLNVTSSYEAWRWDPFSFVDGVVTQQEDIDLNNQTKTVSLPIDPSGSKVKLWLNVASNGSVSAKLSSDQTWHPLKMGSNLIPEIRMSRTSETTLQLKGTGSVGVEYRVGSL